MLFSMRHLGSLRMYDSVLRRLAARGTTSTSWRSGATSPAPASRRRRCWPTCRRSAGCGRTSQSAPGPSSPPRFASGSTTCASAGRGIAGRAAAAPSASASACRPLLRRITDWPGSAPRPAGGRWWPACGWSNGAAASAGARRADARAAARRRAADAAAAARIVADRGAAQRARASARAPPSASPAGTICPARRGSRELPDRVFVWNDTQKTEADRAARRARVAASSSPARSATTSGSAGGPGAVARGSSAPMLGLPADRPFLLYACSALSPAAPTEARFVRRWIERIRASDDPRAADRRPSWCGRIRSATTSGRKSICRICRT